MAQNDHDIGWEHGTPVGGRKKFVKCNYCEKQVHCGITRLKQQIFMNVFCEIYYIKHVF